MLRDRIEFKHNKKMPLYGVFESVIVIVFQSAFHSKMDQNNIFCYFLKIIFDINTSKRYKI